MYIGKTHTGWGGRVNGVFIALRYHNQRWLTTADFRLGGFVRLFYFARSPFGGAMLEIGDDREGSQKGNMWVDER